MRPHRSALQRVTQVVRVPIPPDVAPSLADNPQAKQPMKQNRRKNKHPLHDRQKRSQRVDLIDGFLKRRRAVQDRGVGQQMDRHERPHRDQPRQRMESPNQELMPGEKRPSERRCGHRIPSPLNPNTTNSGPAPWATSSGRLSADSTSGRCSRRRQTGRGRNVTAPEQYRTVVFAQATGLSHRADPLRAAWVQRAPTRSDSFFSATIASCKDAGTRR